MTLVEFHSEVAEPVHFACRLLRKAYNQGHAVLVTAPRDTLQSLDIALWTFDAQGFIPHRRLRPDAGQQAELAGTPIWLAEDAQCRPCPTVLVNLGAAVAPALDFFSRVVEIVGCDPEAVQGARGRWREYLARGLQPSHRSSPARAGSA